MEWKGHTTNYEKHEKTNKYKYKCSFCLPNVTKYLVKDIPVLAVHDCLEGRPLLARPCLPINSLLLFPFLSPTMSSLSCPFTTPVLTCPPCTLLELCPCTSSAPPATASKAKSWMAAIKNQFACHQKLLNSSMSACSSPELPSLASAAVRKSRLCRALGALSTGSLTEQARALG